MTSLPECRSGRATDALLLVDVFDDFSHEDGPSLLASFGSRSPAMIDLVSGARAKGIPVVYANDNYGSWNGEARTIIERALQGPGGALLRRLVPSSDDRFVVKPRYSAFEYTALPLILATLDVRRLLIAGMTTEMCVAQTAIAAREHGYWVDVFPDACACIDERMERVALEYLHGVVGVRLRDLDAIRAIGGRRVASDS